MVTCTAIAFVILQHPRHGHSRQSCAQTKNVVAENVDQHQSPLSLLEIGHSLESVAGEGCERSAKTDHHQQTPVRIDKNTFHRPDEKESDNKAAEDVDEECAVRKDWAELPGG